MQLLKQTELRFQRDLSCSAFFVAIGPSNPFTKKEGLNCSSAFSLSFSDLPPPPLRLHTTT